MIAKLLSHPWRSLLLSLLSLTTAIGIYHVYKPLPEGLSYAGPPRPAHDVRFLADLTYVDSQGERHSEQAIFDELFLMIASAKRFILVDMFLFNPYQSEQREELRAVSSQFTDALIRQQGRHPEMEIRVITDPVNTVYGGLQAAQLDRLEQAGISLTYSHLTALRDSNPLYSAWWRTFLSHWGNSPGDILPNPIGEGRVSLRSYLALLNFKANHRKVAIADSGEHYAALVTSANPHDASSAHGNIALRFSGPAVADLLETEDAVLAMSGGPLASLPAQGFAMNDEQRANNASLRVLTEGAIKRALIEVVRESQPGDQLDMAVFYLSDRDVVEALLAAHSKGVQLRVLLDPNKDAFGRSKNGIPNRQTAHELHAAGVPIRWCDTHGEQCHAKFLLARGTEGVRLLLGSANFTRRNLGDYNLETNVLLEGHADTEALRQAAAWFELNWTNTQDRHFSVAYPHYADEGLWHRVLYRVMEATGLSTF